LRAGQQFLTIASATAAACPLQVEERLGPAAETLETLLADPAQHGSYDFAFIDADKKVQSADRVVVVF
jgi:predicted O-methyltransferase YrrM